jgi:DNA mismatch endonuclease (patch repair protein)
MDRLTPEQRSLLMSKVRGTNTAPEIKVRRALHAMGMRFRLHRKDLPGKPDIVLPKFRLCIFVNGCFWHQHKGCSRSKLPTTNRKFWKNKLGRNQERDQEVDDKLHSKGWNSEVIWECETKSALKLIDRLAEIFSASLSSESASK